jgi:hypothetical protein
MRSRGNINNRRSLGKVGHEKFCKIKGCCNSDLQSILKILIRGICYPPAQRCRSLAGRVRVNSISPGWIDTAGKVYEGADAVQHLAGRVGKPIDIANIVLYLCSDMAGFITGENICIDGGMTRQMIYHGDYGWSLDIKNGD